MACWHSRRLLAATILLGLAAQSAAAATFRTIALTGDVAPGTGGATFGFFSAPRINNTGEVAYRGFLTGSGVNSTNDEVIFGPTGLVAREGDVAPGSGTARFNNFGTPSLSNSGEIVYRGSLRGSGTTSSNDSGIYASSALVVREGRIAPGTGGARFSALLNPSISSSGDIVFQGSLVGNGVSNTNDTGIFTPLELLVREGTSAPGTGGATYSIVDNPTPNDTGEVSFRAFLGGSGVTGASNEGIFTSSSLIAREGDAAPDTAGALFSTLLNPTLNNTGEVAFRGFLTGTGVTSANELGVFTSSMLVARAGDVAPGTGGATFVDLGAPALNDVGEVAFASGLAGTGVTGATNGALFLWDGLSAPSVLIREGSVLDLGGGDLRAINFLLFFNGLNDNGDVAFTAGFTDGSQGVFVLEAEASAPVPLPASGWLLLAGLGAFGVLRRKA